MTLKHFLRDNQIKVSKIDISRLGHKLSSFYKEPKEYVRENNYKVINYPIEFLSSEETQVFIVSSLNEINELPK